MEGEIFIKCLIFYSIYEQIKVNDEIKLVINSEHFGFFISF